jgi:hypothetical protein
MLLKPTQFGAAYTINLGAVPNAASRQLEEQVKTRLTQAADDTLLAFSPNAYSLLEPMLGGGISMNVYTNEDQVAFRTIQPALDAVLAQRDTEPEIDRQSPLGRFLLKYMNASAPLKAFRAEEVLDALNQNRFNVSEGRIEAQG